ncbi:uncharacterized protein EI90DRAFT_3126361 [Cantharellus anzutake]|uniref:uncharacterized protein n=1 Tax=Cantharellus anzutake TaxID=1750568 RepID=UPI0019046DAA|nr:uncharacterized protein EI90DRAFT_3126361 [Cantharellus anzutake]KAF8328187.1 hypothetical protein EI90DRAFT_3126361 [Cantharellus anzutake]
MELSTSTTDLEESPPENSQLVSDIGNSGHTPNVADASVQPATYASGRPMRFTPKWATSLLMCCTSQVSPAEIEDGSAVVRCTAAGCETVWLLLLLYSILLPHGRVWAHQYKVGEYP